MNSSIRKELAARELAQRSLLHITTRFHKTYDASWFHIELCNLIDQFVLDVEAGKEPRLIVTCPPRHGKSVLLSDNLPCYLLGRHPEWEVIIASYNQTIADMMGRKVRDRLNDKLFQDLFDVQLDEKSNAVDLVKTKSGGMFKSTGVGGSLTSLGANVLIIDDPIKDRAAADSAVERENLWDWYTSAARTRMLPGGGIIVIHTRWHVDDLIGRLLKAQQNPEADQWQVYEFPAIAKKDEKHRKSGEALHSARYPVKTLKKIKATLPARDWEALYQCSPFVETGSFFKREFLKWYDELPKDLNYIVGGDYATKAHEANDATAVIPAGLAHDKRIYIHPDFFVERLEPMKAVIKTIQLMKTLKTHLLCHEKGVIANVMEPLFKMGMEQEKHYLVFERYVRSAGKHIHALAIRGMIEAGVVWFPRTRQQEIETWLLQFMPESDGEDDFVDALASLGIALQRAVIKPPAPELPSTPESMVPWVIQSKAFRQALEEKKRVDNQEEDW